MRVSFVASLDLERLLDPASDPWRGAAAETIALIGTPVGMQPTAAIRAAWTGRRIGAVESVAASALHDGRTLAFRLEWSDASEDRTPADTTAFSDGAAVLLPSAAQSSVMTMGAPGAAVNAWYWRADGDEGRHVIAEGLGTSRTLDTKLVRARGVWKEGRWHVVVARALRVDTREPIAQVEAGAATRFALAVWDGASGERAGIKAFSGDWRELVLEPVGRA